MNMKSGIALAVPIVIPALIFMQMPNYNNQTELNPSFFHNHSEASSSFIPDNKTLTVNSPFLSCDHELITAKQKLKRIDQSVITSNFDFTNEINRLNQYLQSLRPNDFVYFLTGDLEFKQLNQSTYKTCFDALNHIDNVIRKELDYTPYDQASTKVFKSLNFCRSILQPLRQKEWFQLQKNSKLRLVLIWNTSVQPVKIDWQKTLSKLEKKPKYTQSSFSTTFNLENNYWYPSLLAIAISDRASYQVLKELLTYTQVRNVDYELALLANHEAFFKLMHDTNHNLNITIRQQSLYDLAAKQEQQASNLFKLLKKYNVDPNLEHGSGEQDLLYRLLIANKVKSANTLVKAGAYIGSKHVQLTSNLFEKTIASHQCQTK